MSQTMLCSAFLAGMLESRLIRYKYPCYQSHPSVLRRCDPYLCLPSIPVCRLALVVAPKTLLAHWETELAACGISTHVHQFTGSQVSRQVAGSAAYENSIKAVYQSTKSMAA